MIEHRSWCDPDCAADGELEATHMGIPVAVGDGALTTFLIQDDAENGVPWLVLVPAHSESGLKIHGPLLKGLLLAVAQHVGRAGSREPEYLSRLFEAFLVGVFR